MRAKPWSLIVLLIIAGAAFFANTWGYDLWPPDEPRFGQVAREMMESGGYIAPHVNGQPYAEKPPLLFWAIALASQPFGGVTECSARIPSGIAALLTILLTYLLAVRLYGRRVALWSGIVLATMGLFWWEARCARTDMLLTACMTGALLAFWRWHEERRARWLLAFYAAIAAGLFAKGPPALLFPMLLVAVFYWRRRNDWRAMHLVLGLGTSLALLLAWYVPARMSVSAAGGIGGEAFRQIVGRVLLGVSKARPPWYYFLNLPANLLPWSLFLPWTIPWLWRRRREGAPMRLLLAWTIPAFVFLSAAIGKRPTYLLPLYPAFAIMIARSVLDLVDGTHAVWRIRTAWLWAGMLLALGAVPCSLFITGYREVWSPGFWIFAGTALALSLYTFHTAMSTDVRNLHTIMASSFAVLAFLAAFLVLPPIDARKGASEFCRPLRSLSETGADYRLYSVTFSREEFIFYTKHFHTPVLIDLVPPELPEDVSVPELSRQLRRLRKAISEAAGEVPLESLIKPSALEREALANAIHQALEDTDADQGLARMYEEVLKDAITQFASAFGEPGPAFMLVPEEMWRCLLPFLPGDAGYSLVRRESVGHRDVMLIANEAGVELL